jgi:hypothetical protein
MMADKKKSGDIAMIKYGVSLFVQVLFIVTEHGRYIG